MTMLFTNIKGLVGARENYKPLRGAELQDLPVVKDAYLIVERQHIAEYGEMKNLKRKPEAFAFHVDAGGRFVLPSWCDSHTHLVFAGNREQEFVEKIKGATYADIAAKGGGILSTAAAVDNTSEDQLFHQAYKRLHEVSMLGTGAIEIKSGYGLSMDGELKMLRVIKRLKAASQLTIKATFLGAHALPPTYKNDRQGYITLITDTLLPIIHQEQLADYIDVFCEQNFFSPQETEHICNAGLSYGLIPKIHANQLTVSGGVQAGIKVNARSVDHLECMDKEAIEALANSTTIGTLLPSAAFFLRLPYPPAREMLNSNCTLALASDYNPGSSPSGNMNFVAALSCIQMKLLPEEAINAATINGAYAMDAQTEVGSITIGKKANLILTQPIPSLAYLPYAFGTHHIEKVMLGGDWVF